MTGGAGKGRISGQESAGEVLGFALSLSLLSSLFPLCAPRSSLHPRGSPLLSHTMAKTYLVHHLPPHDHNFIIAWGSGAAGLPCIFFSLLSFFWIPRRHAHRQCLKAIQSTR